MHLDVTPPTSQMSPREVAWVAAVIAVILGFIALIMYGATTDERAVAKLPAEDRTTLIHAECESLRLLCDEAQPTPGCVDRAKFVAGLEGVDDDCRTRARLIAAPRR